MRSISNMNSECPASWSRGVIAVADQLCACALAMGVGTSLSFQIIPDMHKDLPTTCVASQKNKSDSACLVLKLFAGHRRVPRSSLSFARILLHQRKHLQSLLTRGWSK